VSPSPRLLCQVSDIADPGSKGFKFDQESLFAVHFHGKVYVYRNQCPHVGIEMNWQPDQFLDYNDSLIQCATHGALFIIENGDCVAGPCQGKRLQAIPCRVENGALIIDQ
jgi:nitrite reductase/ring-hydroxylating ferredoxin subunit